MSHKQIPETLTWKTQTHEQHKRSATWYLLFVLCSIGLTAFGIYSHSIITIITFCLVIFSILLFGSQSPKEITYKLSKTGITLGRTVYPYKVIKTFWIIYNPPVTKTLNLETTAYLNNQVVIQLGDQDPVELKLFLTQFLPEDLEREESVTDVLAKTLKI